MSLMDWNAKQFDVLVPKMNDQHHKLVDMMNKLYERAHAKAGKTELSQLISQLAQFTVRHFREEEDMMEAMHFPELPRHKMIHQKLLEDFSFHQNSFNQGNGALSPAFFDFLKLWLTSHIMHIDRKYGDFSQQKKSA